jgi:flagellar hook assembly protein FlgD
VGITGPPDTGAGGSLVSYPNPLTSRTTLSFSTGSDGNVSLTIFDISGRVVRDLVSTFYTSGTSSVEWDGCDNRGNRVVPGIYAGRLIEGDHSKTILIVVQ